MNIIKQPLTKGYSKGWTRTPWAIVHHYTAGYTSQQTYDVLSKRGLSIHFTIERDGTLYRYLEDKDRGWHAGYGQWGGRSNMNHHAFGIEIVNSVGLMVSLQEALLMEFIAGRVQAILKSFQAIENSIVMKDIKIPKFE